MKSDVVIAGGGLSGALIAWRLRVQHPGLAVTVVEQADRLGGNHTWSFHKTDLPSQTLAWMQAMVAHEWPRQQVRFPRHRRVLDTGYCSTTSERLHDCVAPLLGEGLLTGQKVSRVDADGVHLESGQHIAAGAVIDARGQRQSDALTIGFQKFLGQEIRFKQPHGLTVPIIMDATIPQDDGYRFVYVLPFSEDTALVEDTYYADGAALDRDAIRQRIADYCAGAGWAIDTIFREEDGVLPIALAGNIDEHLSAYPPGVGVAGLGAGLFHPLTGYSLPDAAALAERIAQETDHTGPALAALTRAHARERWRDRAFYRMLSRFLFYAAKPEGRHKVLERFYRLNGGLIERFYAAQSSKADKLRTLVGKPPVSFLKAVECVDEIGWRDNIWLPRKARIEQQGQAIAAE
ncbi:MAG: lycopene beta-cyclase CrtY [Pseudomonadota bacterium]